MSGKDFILYPNIREEIIEELPNLKKHAKTVLHSEKMKIQKKFLSPPKDLRLSEPPEDKKYKLRRSLIDFLDKEGKNSNKLQILLESTQNDEDEVVNKEKTKKKSPHKPQIEEIVSEKSSSEDEDIKIKTRRKRKIEYIESENSSEEEYEEEQSEEEKSEEEQSEEEEKSIKKSKIKPRKRQKKFQTPKISRNLNFLEYNQSPIFTKDGEGLKEYQIAGVNWLFGNWFEKRSCILSDEVIFI